MNRIEQIIQQSGLNPSHETINLAHNLIREAVEVILSSDRHRRDYFANKVLQHFQLQPLAPTNLDSKPVVDINPNLSEEELLELEQEMEEWNKSFLSNMNVSTR